MVTAIQNYYDNLSLSENGKFKNNDRQLKWGLEEVKIIHENSNLSRHELARLTKMSHETVRKIKIALKKGCFDKYLTINETHLEDNMPSTDKDIVNIYDGIHITIYNNESITGNGAEETKKINQMKLKAWSKKIKKRGRYICAKCSKVDTEHNQAHHIYPKSRYPSLAYDEGNGIVLCQKCHAEYHKKYEGQENPYTFIGWIMELRE